MVFKGEILKGEQAPILGRDIFDAVQAKLKEQMNNHTAQRMQSEAMLIGRIFDDRGNRTSPSHARKGGVKYRYYLSSTLLNGMADRAGSAHRVPADEIERLITKSVREHLHPAQGIDDHMLVNTHVARVEIQANEIVVQLVGCQEAKTDGERATTGNTLHIPWQKMPSKRRREILVPEGIQPQQARPIRAENRAILVTSIARGRRWLDELTTVATASPESIVKREGCSVRKINMTISLAFLAPNLVRAAIEGRLPRGMGVTRLADLPAEWSQQFKILGLLAQ